MLTYRIAMLYLRGTWVSSI